MLRRFARLAVSPAVSLHLARAVMLNDGHKRRHIAVLLAMGASLVSSTAAACAPKQTDAMAALSAMYQDNESDDGESDDGERDGGDGDDDDGDDDDFEDDDGDECEYANAVVAVGQKAKHDLLGAGTVLANFDTKEVVDGCGVTIDEMHVQRAGKVRLTSRQSSPHTTLGTPKSTPLRTVTAVSSNPNPPHPT